MNEFIDIIKKRILFFVGESYLMFFYFYLFLMMISRKKNEQKDIDIAFFPYSSPSSIGTFLRITQYHKLLEEKKISYKCFYCITDEEERTIEHLSTLRLYFLYSKMLYRRIKAINNAKRARIAFIQRAMFPFYTNQKNPLMEKILKKQGCFVIIDFWDSVWEKNKVLTDNTAIVANQIMVSNRFLFDYFAPLNQNVKIFNIAINRHNYIRKHDYSIKKPIKLAYIGYPANVYKFIRLFEPIAVELKKAIDFKLVIISNGTYKIPYCDVEFFPFNYNDYSKLLSLCDIGLYLVEMNKLSKGKSAMKVLDYLASGLPVVASPWGIYDFEDNVHLLFAENNEMFVEKILALVNNIKLRIKLTDNAQKMIAENFSVEKSIKVYENLCNKLLK